MYTWIEGLHIDTGPRLNGRLCDMSNILSDYNDVIINAMAYQITSLTIVYSNVYSGTDHRKHQSSASLAFVRGIHRSPVNSPHKGPVTQKIFPFDDVILDVRRLTYHTNNDISRTCYFNSCKTIFFIMWYHYLNRVNIGAAADLVPMWPKVICNPHDDVDPSAHNIITVMSHERHRISNHRSLECLCNSFFGLTSKTNQRSALLPFVKEIHRWPVDSPHKGPVMRKAYPFHHANHAPAWWLYRGYQPQTCVSLVSRG